MNDLHWISYEPKRMFLDTIGMSDASERAHRRLSDYIWWNEDAPPNDNEVLRSISQTDPAKWGKVKLELIGKGWVESETAFYHRAVVATLNEANKTYVSSNNRTVGAHNAKNPAEPRPSLELLPPHPETGVIKYRELPFVKTPVTRLVTTPVTSGQSQSQPQSQSKEPDKAYKPLQEKGCGEKPSALSLAHQEVARKCEEVLGEQWLNDAGKWVNRIKGFTEPGGTVHRPAAGKVRRVFAEVENAIKEHRITTTPAQYAEDQWGRFKEHD